LAEVQIKDVAAPTRLLPLVPGTGAVPLNDVLNLAVAAGFAGPVVLEHEARWYADAAPIDDAIAGALRVLAAH
jgi:sugar phosphate isomerase/epimerase